MLYVVHPGPGRGSNEEYRKPFFLLHFSKKLTANPMDDHIRIAIISTQAVRVVQFKLKAQPFTWWIDGGVADEGLRRGSRDSRVVV